MTDFPALDQALLPAGAAPAATAPRFLLLYGSARPGSFSHLLCEEAARLLQHLGGETRIFDPSTLPLLDTAPKDHEKFTELAQLVAWSDAHFWCSPEYIGAPSAIMKAQLDAMMLGGAVAVQGKPLAVAQLSAVVQSFNTTTSLANIGRWIGMLVTTRQLCINQVQNEFDDKGRLKPSPHYDLFVDTVEELFKITAALRDHRPSLIDRYSQRVLARAG